ncbi:MAG: ComF family protein [Dehalococcoidales bacterium]|nr:ComF family protein [Dehalococcoidales bacterium]
MLPVLEGLKKTALDLLFPLRCIECGKEGSLICPACYNRLPWILPPVCPFCGVDKPPETHCTSCPVFQPVIDGMRAPFRFEAAIRSAVHRLKYRNLRAIAAPLASMMADYLGDNPLPYDIIIPVPLHNKRLRERGYNQSELLAKEIGKSTCARVDKNCLMRHRHTPAQAMTKSIQERHSNLADAFICKNDTVRGKKVLLIDDVATSGATLDACAKALKSAGAASVWGLTLARDIR